MVKKIIKFSTTWCGPCRSFAPTFHKVSGMDKYKNITFEEMDIESSDEAETLAQKYQIRTVPTTILFDENDSPIIKVLGNVSEKNFTSIIDEKMA